MFGTAEMRGVFRDDNLLACYVRAEVALAQGRTGVIPAEHAATIARVAPTIAIDRAASKAEAENVGYPTFGLMRQVSAASGEAGRTNLQQALPITFGYKSAVWLSMMQRHAERLAQQARARRGHAGLAFAARRGRPSTWNRSRKSRAVLAAGSWWPIIPANA